MYEYCVSMNNITVAYTDKPVLWRVSATIAYGSMVGIIGPNGAGKSTLIKVLLGMIRPDVGFVTYGKTLCKGKRYSIAYVPQRAALDFDFPVTAFDVVLMGRYGHIGWFKRPSQHDKIMAMQALERVGMQDVADFSLNQLSGGQQQRIFLARALAQDAHLLLLDEPFNGVDVISERIIIDVLQQLCKQGKAVVAVHHDLHTVYSYFDTLLLLNGRCIAYGPLRDVFIDKNIEKMYEGYAHAHTYIQSVTERDISLV